MDWLKSFLKKLGIEKGLINVTAGNVLSSSISGLFFLFLASLMSTKDYGQLNYLLSVAMTASAVSVTGFNSLIMTFLPKGEENLKNQANRMVLLLNCISMVPLIFFVFHLPTLVLIFGLSFFTMTQSELLGRKNYKKYSYIIIAQKILLVVLSLLLYYVMGIDGIILGYAISTLLFSYNYYKTLRGFNLEFKELISKAHFTIHTFSIGIADKVAYYGDKLLIAPLYGFETLGLYQFGFQFFSFLSIIPYSMLQFILPEISSGTDNKRILLTGLIIAIFLSIVFAFLIPFMINSFFPLYKEAILAIQIMNFGTVPLVISNVLGAKLYASGKTKILLISVLMRVAALVILILWFGSTFGLSGLVASFMISLSLQSSFLLILSKFAK